MEHRKIIVFELILWHQNSFFSHNKFPKMASILCKIWLTIFWQKAQFLFIVRTIQFCSKLIRMWSKCLTNNVWRDFLLPMSGSAMVINKCPIRKSIFAVNLELKFFRATIANAEIGSPKFLPTFLWMKLRYLYKPNLWTLIASSMQNSDF